MKKIIIGIALVAVIGVSLGTVASVHAQSTTSPVAFSANGRGGRGGNQGAGTQDGFLHDELIAAYAVKLGISVAQLNARLANGETMAQIAISTGLSLEQFRTLMVEVRTMAVNAAVQNGTLTQEQADWMKLHGAGQAANGGFGVRGSGLGQYANPDCPYYQSNH